MSTSPTELDINTMDVHELRQQLLKDQESAARLQPQAAHITIIEKDKADAELTLLAQTTHSFSPLPSANLSANLNAVAPMDAQQVTEISERLLSQMKTRLIAAFQQSSTQQHTAQRNYNEGKWPLPSATPIFFYSFSLHIFLVREKGVYAMI